MWLATNIFLIKIITEICIKILFSTTFCEGKVIIKGNWKLNIFGNLNVLWLIQFDRNVFGGDAGVFNFMIWWSYHSTKSTKTPVSHAPLIAANENQRKSGKIGSPRFKTSIKFLVNSMKLYKTAQSDCFWKFLVFTFFLIVTIGYCICQIAGFLLLTRWINPTCTQRNRYNGQCNGTSINTTATTWSTIPQILLYICMWSTIYRGTPCVWTL